MADRTRDPFITAVEARQGWTTWHPGDGSSYLVHLLSVHGGPDRADLVLLLNISRRTVAFQWSPADYRHRETGRWTKRMCREQGIPEWAWDAAKPLLDVLGATRDPDKSAEKPPREVTIEAAGGVL
jgi:hypothetical protein